MNKLSLHLRLIRLERFGINKRLNDPARRRTAKLLLVLIVLGGLAALGLVYLYCWGIAQVLQMMNALSALPGLPSRR